MDATFEDFFTGKSLFAFVNIYDMDYYFNYFENKSNLKYSILEAPYFDGISGSYIIPGDLIAINSNSKNLNKSITLLKEMLINYGKFYDSGSFGWFSLVNQNVQARIVNQFKIDKELIYPNDTSLTPASPVNYSFTELMNLNQKFYTCSKTG